jgi:hypothetical protein
MSEMLERVALALLEADIGPGGWPETWVNREIWYRRARAAIAAMREPTLAMLLATEDCPGIGDERGGVRAEWEAMIDEALK